MKTIVTKGILLFSMALLIYGCTGGVGDNNGGANSSKESARMVTATDNADLERRLKAELVHRYERMETRYLYGGISFADSQRGIVTANSAAGALSSTQAAATTAADYSKTNLQEAGVDEGDLVKTDGNYIYLARGAHFFVLKARPAAQTSIVSDIDMKEPINEIYLDSGRVTVVTSTYAFNASSSSTGGVAATMILPPGKSITRAYLYNVTNPVTPTLEFRYDFPGSLQGSRRIGSTTYIVTNHTIDLPVIAYPWDYLLGSGYDQSAYASASTQAKNENLKRIAALSLTDLLPGYSSTPYSSGSAGATLSYPAVACSDLFFPENGNGTDLSLVFTLNVAGSTPVIASSGVFSSWSRIYMSTDSLYLASTNQWWWIEPVAAKGFLPVNPEPWTALHKFAVAGGGKPVYRGSGNVNGWVNDQFSMGEHKGYLRIGTTRGGWWGEGISNQLTVLAEQGGGLVETGKIEGIAPGERIYSMRYDSDRGYMVTYRQTDPLFTFDLSNPAQPRKAAEIIVNGFATYLHLMGPSNSLLLTIGRSANSAGLVTGNKLQLFDVTNLAQPKLIGDFELGSGWSSALYDHHAFLYYETLSLLAIPYYSYSGSGGVYSSGLRLFTVNSSGITNQGTVPAKVFTSTYGQYTDTVDRSVVIGGDIYAVANRSVTVAALDTLLIQAQIDLPETYLLYPLTVVAAKATATKK